MIDTVIFDLDGTLLDFNQDKFINLYFEKVIKKFLPYGYSKDSILNALLIGVDKMVKNTGRKTNEEVFWEIFASFFPNQKEFFEEKFFELYNNEFNEIKDIVSYNADARRVVEFLKDKNIKLILATNPIFPQVATHNRIKWGGYCVDDFSLITTFENSLFCKPNLDYYTKILATINKKAKECLMVGNDVREDMVVEELGMPVFLIVDNLINLDNQDISKYNNGSFKDLYEYLVRIFK